MAFRTSISHWRLWYVVISWGCGFRQEHDFTSVTLIDRTEGAEEQVKTTLEREIGAKADSSLFTGTTVHIPKNICLCSVFFLINVLLAQFPNMRLYSIQLESRPILLLSNEPEVWDTYHFFFLHTVKCAIFSLVYCTLYVGSVYVVAKRGCICAVCV